METEQVYVRRRLRETYELFLPVHWKHFFGAPAAVVTTHNAVDSAPEGVLDTVSLDEGIRSVVERFREYLKRTNPGATQIDAYPDPNRIRFPFTQPRSHFPEVTVLHRLSETCELTFGGWTESQWFTIVTGEVVEERAVPNLLDFDLDLDNPKVGELTAKQFMLLPRQKLEQYVAELTRTNEEPE